MDTPELKQLGGVGEAVPWDRTPSPEGRHAATLTGGAD
jgi:hypothetical protein